MDKIKVAVFFGGASREREVSFAGGRTVYDNLDKSLFDVVLIFIDPFGNFVELDWQYIYKGTIRDFFPPSQYHTSKHYQIYAESLSKVDLQSSLNEIGKRVYPHQFKDLFDVAYLALHGFKGEDGSLQGLLEWYGIPYTGTGILGSALGMNKALQKEWIDQSFEGVNSVRIRKQDWDQQDRKSLYAETLNAVGLPMVVKSANQGSSIGISILKEDDFDAFQKAVDLSIFRLTLSKSEWLRVGAKDWIKQLIDLRYGLALPVYLEGRLFKDPDVLEKAIESAFEKTNEVKLEGFYAEHEVLVESFVEGREFSCIVVVDDEGRPFALPPTEIVKGKEIFDYKSKYLPGLSHKQTPMRVDENVLQKIRNQCVSLFSYFDFEVYARIDGFLTSDGKVLLNDPNTTSGMMPSSFFFHQAAEIGMDPSAFLTFILRSSLGERGRYQLDGARYNNVLKQLDFLLDQTKQKFQQKKTIGVLMGGYSTERHISVESGRNIYEKLSSCGRYKVVPYFLSGVEGNYQIHTLPIASMLKDNADDISKALKTEASPLINRIRTEAEAITQSINLATPNYEAQIVDFESLKKEIDFMFIALHGRPGEDGQVQQELIKVGIPFNGSGPESSSLTIDKFGANNILRDAGILVANALLVQKEDWKRDENSVRKDVDALGWPMILKPSDEGCSSAVLKIKNWDEFKAYAELTFRENDTRDKDLSSTLGLHDLDEFPKKEYFLAETLIAPNGAKHFIEVTGGLYTTRLDNGTNDYFVFEPSEALASGEVLSLAEKFLAGEGQNITPARFDSNQDTNRSVSTAVKKTFEQVARLLNVEGYCRIDAFVRIFEDGTSETIIIEVNSLPGMTPATCIYHQAALESLKPIDFIEKIINFGTARWQ